MSVPDPSSFTEPHEPPPKELPPSAAQPAWRSWGSLALCGSYLLTAVAVAWWWQPLTPGVLVAIAVTPAVAMAAAGVPKVARPGPRGWMALFHLALFPLLAALMAGIPAALLAWVLGETFFAG